MVKIDFSVHGRSFCVLAHNNGILKLSVLVNEMHIVLMEDGLTSFFISCVDVISIVLNLSFPDLLTDVSQSLMSFHFLCSVLDTVYLDTQLVEWFPRCWNIIAMKSTNAALLNLKEEIHFELIIIQLIKTNR